MRKREKGCTKFVDSVVSCCVCGVCDKQTCRGKVELVHGRWEECFSDMDGDVLEPLELGGEWRNWRVGGPELETDGTAEEGSKEEMEEHFGKGGGRE